MAVLFTDVTEAKRAEQERDRLLRALEVERSRLAYVFQQAPTFLAVVRGPGHVFDLVNEAYYGLVGRREIVGKPVRDALPEVREQGFIELLDRVLASGQPYVGREMPVALARTPGAAPEERFVDFVYLPLVEGDGVRSGVIAHGTDVTEQVQARREVERLLLASERARADAEAARAEAEAANRSKSEFLAVMSHELRTPLNAIGGYAELMEMGIRGPVTAARRREDLRRIQTSQRHLLGLINEVLNYAEASRRQTPEGFLHVGQLPAGLDRPAQQRRDLGLAGSVPGAVGDGRGRDVVGQRQLGDLPHVGLPARFEQRSPARAGGSGALLTGLRAHRSLRRGLCVVLATSRFL